jgi:DNA polymerase III delta subunit
VTAPLPPRLFRPWLAAPPASAYLLSGWGTGLCDLLGDLWLKRFADKGVKAELIRWTVPDLERGPFVPAWRSPSFFARVRIHILPDLGEMKKRMRDAIITYLETPDPEVVLVVPSSDRGASKGFSAIPAVRSLFPREEDVVAALAEASVATAREAGTSLPREAALFLVRWVGTDYRRLKEETAKLLTAVEGRGEIDEAAVRVLCAARGGADPFALAEALLRRDAATCLSLFRAFAAAADSQDYHALLGAIAWKSRRHFAGRADKASTERAGQVLSALSRIDRGMKGESRLPPERLFETFLLTLLA